MNLDPTGPPPNSRLSVRPPRPARTEQPASAPAAAPSTDAPQPAETESAGKQRTVRLEDVTFGEIKVADPATFAPAVKQIPDDHPLMQAFRRSYAEKIGLDVATPDQDGMTKILRRIASQEGKGVSIKTPRDGVVSFRATDRRVVNRSKKAGA